MLELELTELDRRLSVRPCTGLLSMERELDLDRDLESELYESDLPRFLDLDTDRPRLLYRESLLRVEYDASESYPLE